MAARAGVGDEGGVQWPADGVEDEDGDGDGAQLLGLGPRMGMAPGGLGRRTASTLLGLLRLGLLG